MNPVLKIIHDIEIKLNRRLSDNECNELLKDIKSQLTMASLNNWADSLPQEIKDSIEGKR